MSYDVIIELRISNANLEAAKLIADRRNKAARELNEMGEETVFGGKWLDNWTAKDVLALLINNTNKLESYAADLESIAYQVRRERGQP